MVNFDDTDFKEAELFSEHIYDSSFDEVVKKGYNPQDEKQRIDGYYPPIVLAKLKLIIPKLYDISKTQGMVYATKLGTSILEHDNRIRYIMDNVPDKIENLTEFQYNELTSNASFTYATPTHQKVHKIPVLEYVGKALNNMSEYLGLSDSHVIIAVYFLGVESASKISPKMKSLVSKENDKFWEFIEHRKSHF